MADDEWENMTDWSNLPPVYLTKVERQNGIIWRIEACSVPMAIAPEVRLVVAGNMIPRAEADAMVAAALRMAASYHYEKAKELRSKPFSELSVMYAQEHAAEGHEYEADRILSLTPADAVAALDAVRKEARLDGMRMAADANLLSRGLMPGHEAVIDAVRNNILAAMEEPK